MKRILTVLACAVLSLGQVMAQDVPAAMWGNTPTLRVEGNNFVDPYGNVVVLHGVMDTPSPYFNGNRWGNSSSSVADAKNAVAYFEKLFTAMTDTAQGAYCNLFRLHLDPCWTNYSGTKAAGFRVEGSGWNAKYYDPHGNEVSNEANIYNFNAKRLESFMKTLYFPIAKSAIDHGMYVIMRPPGVFPGYVEVGDYYNDYITKVWDIVTQNDSVKKYAGQIMIEMGNEPVDVKGNLADFFQPAVDKMRANGYTGIILAPGTGYQSNYTSYNSKPLVDDNYAYAVHNYPGWYGGWDANQSIDSYISTFEKQVPIDKKPIVITEIDWSPMKEGAGHWNEDHTQYTEGNFGSWGTGTTDVTLPNVPYKNTQNTGWGTRFRTLVNRHPNISWTLEGTHDYLDIDVYLQKGKVQPGFLNAMKAAGYPDAYQACSGACFVWYKEYAMKDYARPDLSKKSDDPGLEVVQLKAESKNVTKMVGEKLDFAMSAVFANGMDSKIPASLFTCNKSDESVVAIKDGNIVATGEGENEIELIYVDPTGKENPVTASVTVVPAFTLSKDFFKAISGTSSIALNSIRHEITFANQTKNTTAVGGWKFDGGLDYSKYSKLVFTFSSVSKYNPILIISNSTDPNEPCYSRALSSTDKVVEIDLNDMVLDDFGNKVDPANIKMVAIRNSLPSTATISSVKISDVHPEMAEDPDGISDISSSDGAKSVEYFNINGQRTSNFAPGINIVRKTMSNGEVKVQKILVK